jgi:cyclomaltodextrinase / maltogenic alpha-amylase / neopullulanase
MKILTSGVLGLILFICSGCAKNEYAEVHARPSADWVKAAFIYEIQLHPAEHEGAWKAIENSIHELKEIGVTVISLSSIHPVGELNRKERMGSTYAVKDFYAVNPEYGTINEFRSLVNIVHKQGMKVIINLVAGGTSWDNPILMDHPDWFRHDEEGAIISPNADLYDVAQLDYRQHEPRKFMIALMKYWVGNVGVDGFHCSLSELVPLDFWNTARTELDKIKPILMISDFSLPSNHITAFDLTYSLNIDHLLSTFFSDTVSVSVLHDSLQAELNRFPKGSLHIRLCTSSETERNTPGKEKLSSREEKAKMILSWTIPGIPFMRDTRKPENALHGDHDNSVNSFWTGGEEFKTLQKQLNMLRQTHPALRNGYFEFICNSQSTKALSFLRSYGNDSLMFVMNFKKEKMNIDLKMPSCCSPVWIDHGANKKYQVQDSSMNVSLPPLSYLVLAPDNGRSIL